MLGIITPLLRWPTKQRMAESRDLSRIGNTSIGGGLVIEGGEFKGDARNGAGLVRLFKGQLRAILDGDAQDRLTTAQRRLGSNLDGNAAATGGTLGASSRCGAGHFLGAGH